MGATVAGEEREMITREQCSGCPRRPERHNMTPGEANVLADEVERLRERVEELECHMRGVLAGDQTHPRFGWEDEGNAPGHSHAKPGVWDWDNGERAHKPREWCSVWYAVRVVLEKP